MGRFKPVDYNQTLFLSVSLQEQLIPGSFEHAVHTLIEERIDLTPFYERYKNDDGGRPAYDPRILLKIILTGYARGILSSRRLEQACRENILFIALSCNSHPDHATIAGFIANMGDLAKELFVAVLLICEEESLLDGTHLSVDGTKLSSNAAKEWSGKIEDLKKKRDKINAKIQEAITTHKRADANEGDDEEQHKQYVRKLQKSADKIQKFLDEEEPRLGRSGREVQSNITDNESAKMSTSHGTIQGYNANALVDDKHQIIVAAEAFGHGGDYSNLGPIVRQARDNLRDAKRVRLDNQPIITADTSYFSNDNLREAAELEIDAYIPDPKFRQRDSRFRDRDRHRTKTLQQPDRRKKESVYFKPKDFTYDADANKLICPAGERLYSNGSGLVSRGRRAHRFRSNEQSCADCKLKPRCIRNPNTKTRQVTMTYEHVPTKQNPKATPAQAMREKIDTVDARSIYRKRLGIVEPVFANMCTHKGMDKFTLRGRAKVNLQWLLYCAVNNIGKIARFAFQTQPKMVQVAWLINQKKDGFSMNTWPYFP